MRQVPGVRPRFLESLPSMRTLLLPLIGTLLLVLVSVTAVASVANYFLNTSTPDAAVDSYLDKLERGSARQILAPLTLVRDDPALQNLPNTVYRGGSHRPVSHKILSVEEQGGKATVVAEVRLHAVQKPRTVTYYPKLRTGWGPFGDSWYLPQVDSTMVAVDLPAAVDALEVNGHVVTPLKDTLRAKGRPVARTWQFEGLPGEYFLRFPDDSYLTATKYTVAVVPLPPTDTVSVALPFRPAPRMLHEVDQEINKAVQRCETALHPERRDCPLPQSWDPRSAGERKTPNASSTPGATPLPRGVSDVTWKLSSRPLIALQSDEKDPLEFTTGRQTARAEVTYLRDGKRRKEIVNFTIDAGARTTGQHAKTYVAFVQPAAAR